MNGLFMYAFITVIRYVYYLNRCHSYNAFIFMGLYIHHVFWHQLFFIKLYYISDAFVDEYLNQTEPSAYKDNNGTR